MRLGGARRGDRACRQGLGTDDKTGGGRGGRPTRRRAGDGSRQAREAQERQGTSQGEICRQGWDQADDGNGETHGGGQAGRQGQSEEGKAGRQGRLTCRSCEARAACAGTKPHQFGRSGLAAPGLATRRAKARVSSVKSRVEHSPPSAPGCVKRPPPRTGAKAFYPSGGRGARGCPLGAGERPGGAIEAAQQTLLPSPSRAEGT